MKNNDEPGHLVSEHPNVPFCFLQFNASSLNRDQVEIEVVLETPNPKKHSDKEKDRVLIADSIKECPKLASKLEFLKFIDIYLICSDDNDSSQSTDEEVDLEEGEILDSGAEEEEEKDFTNSSLKEALDKSCLQNIEQLVNHRNNTKPLDSPDRSKVAPRKLNKMAANYVDHDRLENTSDQEDGWFPDSQKYKSKYDEKPVDYRMELAAYRGTPPSSPERKKRDDKSRKKKSSAKKAKKTRKTIKRKDIRGLRVAKYVKDSVRGKICKFYKEGKCSKGSDCLYSHFAPPPPFKKKELCKFYLNGHCNKGKDCLYMHNILSLLYTLHIKLFIV
ncbi:uncharacterized protein TNCV_773801 [Trichonephila clavipes]|nr:uncharacterized protein TNCV_773801 [Trichonephila clavipes]